MLRCLDENETTLVLMEVHEGVCGSHIGGMALVNKLLKTRLLLAKHVKKEVHNM